MQTGWFDLDSSIRDWLQKDQDRYDRIVRQYKEETGTDENDIDRITLVDWLIAGCTEYSEEINYYWDKICLDRKKN